MRLRLLLGALLVLAPAVAAQTTGKLTGRVTDATTGEPLPGVNVFIDGTQIGTATDLNGEYTVIGIRPGTYDVVASFIGFATARQEGVRMSVDLTTRVDFELREEVFEGEEVVVEADANLVRRDLTSSELRVTSETIANLPVQELGDILSAQAGITTSGGGIHIRGGRSKEVAYFVDGVRVTDAYDGSQSVVIENEGIEELQIISGTYNAEYGQAMSGIINVVTKEPEREFHGSIEAYSGSYVVGGGDGAGDALRNANTDAYRTVNGLPFYGVDPYGYLGFDPTHYYSLQGSLSGPVLPGRLGFFALGRYFKNDGWLYGARLFDPTGTPAFASQTVKDLVREAGYTPADSALVPMNPYEKFSGQANLKLQLGSGVSLSLLGLGSYATGKEFDFGFRANPDGVPPFTDYGYNVNLQLTHALSARTFYTLNASSFYKRFQRRLYDDPLDVRYNTFLAALPDSVVTDVTLNDQGQVTGTTQVGVASGGGRFNRGGTRLDRFDRHTTSYVFKGDVTSQVHPAHLAKAGFEVKLDDVFFESYSLIPNGGFDPSDPASRAVAVPGPESNAFQQFSFQPFTAAAYVQDKIEFEDFIVNAGLRFDYFAANAEIPSDPSDPNYFNPQKKINRFRDLDGDGVISAAEETPENAYTLDERRERLRTSVDPKFQVSPRLGVAYPITTRGVIHFSYGYFFQIPTYEYLFGNPSYAVSNLSGTYGPFGNPDLKAQRTVMYEIGLQQGLGDDLLVDVTGFYRDVTDWVGTSAIIPATLPGVGYVVFANRDYSNVRGITLAVSRRFAQGFSFDLDYTFQVAEGTASNPDEEFNAVQGGAQPRVTLVALEWDQRHTLNSSVYVGGRGWGASALARVGSGYPYTPSRGQFEFVGIFPEVPTNAFRKPATFTVDLNLFRDFPLGPVTPRVFLQVYNLLDARNANTVFSDTGLADATLTPLQEGAFDAGLYVRPDFYSEPRRVQLGLEVKF